MAPPVKKKRDKQEDEAVVSVRTDIGSSGPINWPIFDPSQPLRASRSRAPWSLPVSCGPLVAGAPTLLPAFTPRNHHLTTPHELDVPFDVEHQVLEQLTWLQAAHGDAPVPRDLIKRLLREHQSANLDFGPFRRVSHIAQAAAVASGYPAYDAAAANLRGSRLAAVPLEGGVTAVFSATGQIGEVLTLTLLRPAAADGLGAAGVDGVDGAVGGSGAGGGGGSSSAAVGGNDEPCLQAYPAAHLSLNKTIWQIAAREQRHPRPPHLAATAAATAATRTPGASGPWGSGGRADGGGGVLRPSSWRLTESTTGQAQQGQHGEQQEQWDGGGGGFGVEAGPGTAAGAGTGAPAAGIDCPAVWLAVRCNFAVNVLLAYQVDAADWRSWRLEWRASHTTNHLTANVAWNPHLPELAFLLGDGSAYIAATHAAEGEGLAAGLRQLAVRPVLRPVGRPETRSCFGATAPEVHDPQGLALMLGTGRLCLAYGAHPRTLLVARQRDLLRVELRAPGQRHTCRLLLRLGKKDGNFWGLASGASLAATQLDAAPHLLPHLALAVTEREVLLLDLRRPGGAPTTAKSKPGDAGGLVLAAVAHGFPRGQTPTLAALSVLPPAVKGSMAAAAGREGVAAASDGGGGGGRQGGQAPSGRDGGGGAGSGAGAAVGSGSDGDVAMEDVDGAGGGGSGSQQRQAPFPASQHADFDPFGSQADEAGGHGAGGGDGGADAGMGLYGTQASQHQDPFLDVWDPQLHQPKPEHQHQARQQQQLTSAATATAAAAPVADVAHLLLLLGSEVLGDVMCAEVALGDAPLGMRVTTPPPPAPDANLTTEDLRKVRLPYIELLPPPREYGATRLPALQPPQPPQPAAGTTAPLGAAGPHAAGEALPAVALAAAAQLPRLADALWRPGCLAHLHVLGLPYPACRTIRQELGRRLITALEGARSQAYGTPGVGSVHWGRHGRPAQVAVEFAQASRHSPDLAGLAASHLPLPRNARSTNSALGTASPPPVLLRLSYDGDLVLQPLRRMPPGTPAPTRAPASSAAAAVPSLHPPDSSVNANAAAAAVASGAGVAAAGAAASCGDATRGAMGLAVEVLESPFILADLSSRLRPATYAPLLAAYRSATEAFAATHHLAPNAGWLPYGDAFQFKVRQQAEKEAHKSLISLRAHHVHMSSLLRWAAAGRGAGADGAEAAAAGGSSEGQAATDADDEGEREEAGGEPAPGDGSSWPPGPPRWRSVLQVLPFNAATGGGGKGGVTGGGGEAGATGRRGQKASAAAAARQGAHGAPAFLATQEAPVPLHATQEAPSTQQQHQQQPDGQPAHSGPGLEGTRRKERRRPRGKGGTQDVEGFLPGFDRVGAAVVRLPRPEALPAGVWTLLRAVEAEDADGGEGPEEGEGDDNEETAGQGQPAVEGATRWRRRSQSQEPGAASRPPPALAYAARVVRQAVRQRLQAARHPLMVSELTQAAVDAAAAEAAGAVSRQKFCSRVRNREVREKGDRLVFTQCNAHRPAAAVDRLAAVVDAECAIASAAAAATATAAAAPKAAAAVAGGVAPQPPLSAPTPSGASLWELEYQEHALMALEVGKLAVEAAQAEAEAEARAAVKSDDAAAWRRGAAAAGQGHPQNIVDSQGGGTAAEHPGGDATPVADEEAVAAAGAAELEKEHAVAAVVLRSLGHIVPTAAAAALGGAVTVATAAAAANGDRTAAAAPSPQLPRPGSAVSSWAGGVAYMDTLLALQSRHLRPMAAVLVPDPSYPLAEVSAAADADAAAALETVQTGRDSTHASTATTIAPGMAGSRPPWCQPVCSQRYHRWGMRAMVQSAAGRVGAPELARCRHDLQPAATEVPPPGCRAVVLTPAAAAFLDALVNDWPEYDSGSVSGVVNGSSGGGAAAISPLGPVGAAAGASQPLVQYAPSGLVDWALRLRPAAVSQLVPLEPRVAAGPAQGVGAYGGGAYGGVGPATEATVQPHIGPGANGPTESNPFVAAAVVPVVPAAAVASLAPGAAAGVEAEAAGGGGLRATKRQRGSRHSEGSVPQDASAAGASGGIGRAGAGGSAARGVGPSRLARTSLPGASGPSPGPGPGAWPSQSKPAAFVPLLLQSEAAVASGAIPPRHPATRLQPPSPQAHRQIEPPTHESQQQKPEPLGTVAARGGAPAAAAAVATAGASTGRKPPPSRYMEGF